MNADPISLVSTLIEAGNVDTVYRDLYSGRGRALHQSAGMADWARSGDATHSEASAAVISTRSLVIVVRS